uniref:ME-53 n=1 Tax=Epinotia aporema granulovirus TaxID=166056 RepID=Q91KX4_9BBAC|nr:ME-53 [Epinotia aporema granulovirus]
MNFLVNYANFVRKGENVSLTPMEDASTICFNCRLRFDKKSYIFVVLQDFVKDVNCFRICCLGCRNSLPMYDFVELYPTLSLNSVRKLVSCGVLKKLVFDFDTTNQPQYKRFSIKSSVEECLNEIMEFKHVDKEINTIEIVYDNNKLIGAQTVDDMRVDHNTFNFDKPLVFTKKFMHDINQHLDNDKKFSLNVYYTQKKYMPFVVFYYKPVTLECVFCANKLLKTGQPILTCSACGFTSPDYWAKRANYYRARFKYVEKDVDEMKKRKAKNPQSREAFWHQPFESDKLFWTTDKQKGTTKVSLLCYNSDVYTPKQMFL